ncbi:MAG: hypothetical protein ABGY96_27885 [bacterium]
MSLLKTFLELRGQSSVVQDSFRRELITEATLPMSFAVMEGGFIGVIADKLYQVSPWVIAVITAAPMFSNLSSFLWAKLIKGRPKVPVIVIIQYLVLFFTGIVAFAPSGDEGVVLIVSAVIIVRLLMTGQITARSLVWSLNYGRSVRARIAGRLIIINNLTMLIVVGLGSLALDANAEAFRWLFCAAALIGLVGVRSFTGIQVIDEDKQLALENNEDQEGQGTNLWFILWQDRDFARYQLYQFLAGTSNMMLEAPLIYLVSNQLGASYTLSIAITVVTPFLVTMLTLPVWARYLDNNHVTHFRARQSGLWVLYQLIVFLGAFSASLLLLGLGRFILGIARGGGSLAWNLGHNDFASQKLLAAYMGAHVTLTGIRGAIAPFVGILLYLGWSDVVFLPDFEGIGVGIFLVAACFSTLSWWGYRGMGRALTASQSAPVETEPAPDVVESTASEKEKKL